MTYPKNGPLAAWFADKRAIRDIVAQQNREIGFVPAQDATAEKAQSLALAEGIRPEDNILSFGVIAARGEE